MSLTYKKWKSIKSDDWKNAPINPTCETVVKTNPIVFCGEPTVAAYPAMNSGWMPLCCKHARKHPDAFKTDELIANGETWE
jgi:hypothetical protein